MLFEGFRKNLVEKIIEESDREKRRNILSDAKKERREDHNSSLYDLFKKVHNWERIFYTWYRRE